MTYCLEDVIEFLDESKIQARKIIIIANKIKPMKGGAAHEKARGIAKGNAYCYTEFKVISIG